MAAVMKAVPKRMVLARTPEPTITKTIKAPARMVPLGTLIDGIWEARESKRRLDEQLKLVEADVKSREEALLDRLSQEGLDASRGKLASVSVTTNLCATIVDWDALTDYIKSTGYFHLLHRRVSDPAARELFETTGSVPGLEPFSKRRLNLRSLTPKE